VATNSVGAPSPPVGGYGAFAGNQKLRQSGDVLQRELIEIAHAVDRTRVETLGRTLSYVDLGSDVSGPGKIDIADGFFQLVGLGGDVTITLTNLQQYTAGQLYLEITTNGYAITWGTTIAWCPSGVPPYLSGSHSYLFLFTLMKDVCWGQMLGYR
jgi:hypothetical protein